MSGLGGWEGGFGECEAVERGVKRHSFFFFRFFVFSLGRGRRRMGWFGRMMRVF